MRLAPRRRVRGDRSSRLRLPRGAVPTRARAAAVATARARDIMENAVEKVAQADVCESLLSLRRPRRKHRGTVSVLHRREPERRLANARLSLEHERSGRCVRPLDEGADGGELRTPRDDLPHHPPLADGDGGRTSGRSGRAADFLSGALAAIGSTREAQDPYTARRGRARLRALRSGMLPTRGRARLRTEHLDRRGVVRATRSSCVFRRCVSTRMASPRCGSRHAPLVGWFVAAPWNSGPPFLVASLIAPCIAAGVLIRNSVLRTRRA